MQTKVQHSTVWVRWTDMSVTHLHSQEPRVTALCYRVDAWPSAAVDLTCLSETSGTVLPSSDAELVQFAGCGAVWRDHR